MSALILTTVLAFASPTYGDGLSADQAARRAESRYGGQVLDIRPVQTDKGQGYRIKLLQPSGRVKMLVIDDDDRGNSNRGNSSGKGKGRH